MVEKVVKNMFGIVDMEFQEFFWAMATLKALYLWLAYVFVMEQDNGLLNLVNSSVTHNK